MSEEGDGRTPGEETVFGEDCDGVSEEDYDCYEYWLMVFTEKGEREACAP